MRINAKYPGDHHNCTPFLAKLLLSGGLALALLFSLAGSGLALSASIDLGQNQQSVVVRSNVAHSYLSEVNGVGDFNKDGFSDLLMGAAGYNKSGSFSGAAFVLMGGAGLPAALGLTDPQIGTAIYGASTNDVLGHSVAACDVNGDGYSDMLVGADGYNQGSKRGAVYVFLGGANIPKEFNLKTGPNKPAVTITGEQDGNRLGRSLACGDINGDGRGDIVAGAYTSWPGGRVEAGAVYAVLGSASISNSTPITIALSTQAAALTIYGQGGAPAAPPTSKDFTLADLTDETASPLGAAPSAEIGDRLGRSIAVGDVNGDGLSDIIAGAYGANVGAKLDAGKTYVFYGSASYSTGAHTIDLASNPAGANVTLNGIDAGDQSGFYVGAGNLNGDKNGTHPIQDILTSAYFSQGFNNAEGAESGEVYAVYGSAALPATINLSAGSNLTIYAEQGGDRLGRSVSSGDLNGDGLDEYILGASRADPNGRTNAGEVYVIYGASSLPAVVQLSSPVGLKLTRVYGAAGSDVICSSEVPNTQDCPDEAGHSTTTGDFNKDGKGDLVVGALFANNGSLVDAGASYILYGTADSASHRVYMPLLQQN